MLVDSKFLNYNTFAKKSNRGAHSNSSVTNWLYRCVVIDVKRACVKGETSIPIIDKVSGVSDMIEQTLSFTIHITVLCTI